MSLRTELCDYLETVCANTAGLEKVRVVRVVRDLGELSQPTLIVKTDSYEKLAAAPIRKRLGNFTITLVSNHDDIDRAETQLDDLLEALLPALFTAGLSWQEATQVEYSGNLAFDIRITSIVTQED
jgi:hypothetical protein